jgi:hypothetical protein
LCCINYIVILPEPDVHLYILYPPVTVIVGEPVVAVAALKVSGYLTITTPEEPACPLELPQLNLLPPLPELATMGGAAGHGTKEPCPPIAYVTAEPLIELDNPAARTPLTNPTAPAPPPPPPLKLEPFPPLFPCPAIPAPPT